MANTVDVVAIIEARKKTVNSGYVLYTILYRVQL